MSVKVVQNPSKQEVSNCGVRIAKVVFMDVNYHENYQKEAAWYR